MGIPVVGIGAGGHAKVVIDILCQAGIYDVVGLLDIDEKLFGQKILGVPVLGSDEYLVDLKERGVKNFFVGIGGTYTLTPRKKIYEFAIGCELSPIHAIHLHATISPAVKMGQGVTIMANAVVNASANLGNNVIITLNGVLF